MKQDEFYVLNLPVKAPVLHTYMTPLSSIIHIDGRGERGGLPGFGAVFPVSDLIARETNLFNCEGIIQK